MFHEIPIIVSQQTFEYFSDKVNCLKKILFTIIQIEPI